MRKFHCHRCLLQDSDNSIKKKITDKDSKLKTNFMEIYHRQEKLFSYEVGMTLWIELPQ